MAILQCGGRQFARSPAVASARPRGFQPRLSAFGWIEPRTGPTPQEIPEDQSAISSRGINLCSSSCQDFQANLLIELSLSRIKLSTAKGEDEPGIIEGTAEVPPPITDAHLP